MAYPSCKDDKNYCVLERLSDSEGFKLRNDASQVISSLRKFIEETPVCHLPILDYKGNPEHHPDGGDYAFAIRQHSEKVPPACVALAELEFQLVRLADGNFHEVVEEYRH